MAGRRRKPGGMGPFIEGYRVWLAGREYIPGTIVNMLAMAGGLGRWMDARGVAPGGLDRLAVTEYMLMRRPACLFTAELLPGTGAILSESKLRAEAAMSSTTPVATT